jgi:hypothetical protein
VRIIDDAVMDTGSWPVYQYVTPAADNVGHVWSCAGPSCLSAAQIVPSMTASSSMSSRASWLEVGVSIIINADLGKEWGRRVPHRRAVSTHITDLPTLLRRERSGRTNAARI